MAGLASAVATGVEFALVATGAAAGEAVAGAAEFAVGVAAKEAEAKTAEAINRAANFFMRYLSVVEEENLQSLGVILQRPPNTGC